MKKSPFPDKMLKTDADVEEYLADLVRNTLNWLELGEYVFSIFLPSDKEFKPLSDDFGYEIHVKSPYKKFVLYVSQHEVDLCKRKNLRSQVFRNIERSVFHECIHILLHDIEELGRKRFTDPDHLHDANERITDHLANIIHGLVEEARKAKK